MAWTWQMMAPQATRNDTTAQAATQDTTAGDTASAESTPGDEHFGAPANGFASQADAEAWLGTVWRDLAAGGVTAASLFEDDRLVYGPMSLEPY